MEIDHSFSSAAAVPNRSYEDNFFNRIIKSGNVEKAFTEYCEMWFQMFMKGHHFTYAQYLQKYNFAKSLQVSMNPEFQLLYMQLVKTIHEYYTYLPQLKHTDDQLITPPYTLVQVMFYGKNKNPAEQVLQIYKFAQIWKQFYNKYKEQNMTLKLVFIALIGNITLYGLQKLLLKRGRSWNDIVTLEKKAELQQMENKYNIVFENNQKIYDILGTVGTFVQTI